MKLILTRKKLYEYDKEFQELKKQWPGTALLLKEKIQRFYEKAEHELKVTASRYEAIQNLYVQRNLDGTFKMEEKDGKKEWLLITDPELLKHAGVPDVSLVEQHFNIAADKLFSQTISFDW